VGGGGGVIGGRLYSGGVKLTEAFVEGSGAVLWILGLGNGGSGGAKGVIITGELIGVDEDPVS